MGYLVNKAMARTARCNRLCIVGAEEAVSIRAKNRAEFLEYCSGKLAKRIILQYCEGLQTSICDSMVLGFAPSEEQILLISNLHTAVITDVWRRMEWQTQPLQEVFGLSEMDADGFDNAACTVFAVVFLLCFLSHSSQ